MPVMMYSTSKTPPQRAMKIFYNTVTNPFHLLEKQSNKIGELQLPSYALETLKSNLQTSTSFLPPSARAHQTWTIGLLDR